MAVKFSLGRLNPNKDYAVQIKARRKSDGKESEWSPIYKFKTISDQDAPETPSLPTVTDFIGTLIVGWDGKDKNGQPMEADFSYVAVHAGTSPDFAPTAGNLYQSLYGAFSQETAIINLPFNTDHYVKFVAVDVGGNVSPPTAGVKGTPRKVYGDDVAPKAITQDSINFDARDLGAPYVYTQTSEPTSGMRAGDTWYDTDDQYKLYTYTGTQWIAPTATANGGQAGATGVQVYRQNATPTGGTYRINDVWFDTDDGNVINLWTGSQWERQPFGTNAIQQLSITNALIGNLDASKITSGFIAGDRIQANSLDASKITAGSITTDRIGANQITGAKIAANSITAGSAIIADAAIQSAKIGSVSAGAITSGFIAATLTVSGTIRTSTNVAHSRMDVNGFTTFDSSGVKTFYADANGQVMLKGQIRATTFYSAGIDTGGTNFIEIGDAYRNETGNDEIRFVNGGSGASMRNPNSNPGRLRISVREATNATNTATFDFDYQRGIMSPVFTVGGANARYPSISSGGELGFVTLFANDSGVYSYPLYLGTVQNLNHGWVASRGTGISLLSTSAQMNVRNANNSDYGDIRVKTAFTDNISSSGDINSNNGYMYARWNLTVGQNVEARSGYMYARQFFPSESATKYKTNITELNLDMYPYLEAAAPHVWDWLPVEHDPKTGERTLLGDEPTGESDIGLLVDQLPDFMTDIPGADGETYSMLGLTMGLWQASRQLLGDIRILQDKVKLLENGNE